MLLGIVGGGRVGIMMFLLGFLLGTGGLIFLSWLTVASNNLSMNLNDEPYFRFKEFKSLGGYLDEDDIPMIGKHKVRINKICYTWLYYQQELERARAKKREVIDDVKGNINE